MSQGISKRMTLRPCVKSLLFTCTSPQLRVSGATRPATLANHQQQPQMERQSAALQLLFGKTGDREKDMYSVVRQGREGRQMDQDRTLGT